MYNKLGGEEQVKYKFKVAKNVAKYQTHLGFCLTNFLFKRNKKRGGSSLTCTGLIFKRILYRFVCPFKISEIA